MPNEDKEDKINFGSEGDQQGETQSEETSEEKYEEEAETRTEVRVLYKKCLKCRALIPWVDNIHSCVGDPECPAKFFTFVRGRDPKALIEQLGGTFSAAMMAADEKKFMSLLRKMVTEKGLRPHIFDSLCMAFAISEETQVESKDAEVDY